MKMKLIKLTYCFIISPYAQLLQQMDADPEELDFAIFFLDKKKKKNEIMKMRKQITSNLTTTTVYYYKYSCKKCFKNSFRIHLIPSLSMKNIYIYRKIT